MKKPILLLMMGFSLLTFSQEPIFTAKYMQICEFDYDEDDYIINDEDWINTELETSEEYAIFKLEGEETKIWWEFNEEESNDDYSVYYTENNIDKFVFDYTEEEIYMFSEYNNSTNQYDELLILSKITVEE
tara:strand:- start:102 stop:494 length:393 start_codon:yes stop_codon:yes gene_type:complete